MRHRYDEDTYARQMYCLGRYYNDALLGIETNFSTYPVKLLALMGYPTTSGGTSTSTPRRIL